MYRRTLGALTACAAIIAGTSVTRSAWAGVIVPVSQERTANVMTIVPPCEGNDFDSVEAVDFRPFIVAVDAVNICDFAQGIACAAQNSDISPSHLNAWGNVTSSASSAFPTVIHAIPATQYQVTFQIDSTVEYRLDAQLGAQGALPVVYSQSRVKLTGPAGEAIVDEAVLPNPDGTLNQQSLKVAGILVPGSHTLLATTAAVIDSTVPPVGLGVGQFNIEFHAAIPGDANDDNLVNVADVLAVISAWGACEEASSCLEDIAPVGGDGLVNVHDLLKVINHWSM